MAARTYWNYAITAVRHGISANEALTRLAAAGQGIRRSDWLDIMRAAREELAINSRAYDRNGNRKPRASETLTMFTVVESGYMQHIDIWVKNNETGEIYPRPYSIRTDTLMTHNDAIETALDRYEGYVKIYGETILGAAYSATYLLVPQGK